tara:strand:- start:1148 stop:1351 length:204 start_codon:yes stop_codon:yes gene_type:complete
MCGSIFRPKMPAPPPAPEPVVQAPAVVENKQAMAKPAGYTGTSAKASSYDKKRVGSSKLRIPIVGGV